MTKHFNPLSFEKLCAWIIDEYNQEKTIFGVPEELFFRPASDDPFVSTRFGHYLETPVGVAAGPHTQLSQNIITAWLCGARYIELKTVQTLDELDVSKPCIDMDNEGYNCEWSQELRLDESYREYLNAWIMIHLLHRMLGFDNGREITGTVFNMSVGYNLEGIQGERVQTFLRKMRDASKDIDALKAVAARFWPEAANLSVPGCISDNITLSTMHGCPPAEIEKIATFLVKDGYHTTIKFNPTLAGPEEIRSILNDKLGYPTSVPDEAFEHDPGYDDALSIIQRVSEAARNNGVEFSFKISNTLESVNHRDVFPAEEKMMYMSGKPLHVIDVSLCNRMMGDTMAKHSITFSGGVDYFNVADVIACNIRPVTVSSDVLKPGGYGRMTSYLEQIRSDIASTGSASLEEHVCKVALYSDEKDLLAEILVEIINENKPAEEGAESGKGSSRYDEDCEKAVRWLDTLVEGLQDRSFEDALIMANDNNRDWLDSFEGSLSDVKGVRDSIPDMRGMQGFLVRASARLNIMCYAEALQEDNFYYHSDFQDAREFKGRRQLNWFDCTYAPCTEECPVNQNIPAYMFLVGENRLDEAAHVVLQDNPLPAMAGRVCDHMCQTRCMRTHYEEPLAIREVKRFIIDNAHLNLKPHGNGPGSGCAEGAEPAGSCAEGARKMGSEKKVAIIGAGPAGLSCAYFLGRHGCRVTIFEAADQPGGMAANAIPAFRLPSKTIESDVRRIQALGVDIRLNQPVGESITMPGLLDEGYDAIFVAAGAQGGRKLDIEGEDAEGVYDQLDFLARLRADSDLTFGDHIGVIGGGNSAVDVARSAWRLKNHPRVTLIYRRTINEMPADREEIQGLLEEGIEIVELASPNSVEVDSGRIVGLECLRMKLGEPDESGRRRPEVIEGSNFSLKLDALVSAISQDTMLDFLADMVETDKNGHIIADSDTGKTSHNSVYSGGDVVRGPATLIKAAGDGKKVAYQILGLDPEQENYLEKGLRHRDLVIRKSCREFSDVDIHIPVDRRRNFDEMARTLDEAEARVEAARCLYCDQYCGICTLVCPNRANISWTIQPFQANVPVMKVENGDLVKLYEEKVVIAQSEQIVNIGDFCNECGNCTTFCPSADAPYKSKPRLYLTEKSFDHEEDGLMLQKHESVNGRVLVARINGIIHRIVPESAGKPGAEDVAGSAGGAGTADSATGAGTDTPLRYHGSGVTCLIDAGWNISDLHVEPAADMVVANIYLKTAIELAAIYRGLVMQKRGNI